MQIPERDQSQVRERERGEPNPFYTPCCILVRDVVESKFRVSLLKS